MVDVVSAGAPQSVPETEVAPVGPQSPLAHLKGKRSALDKKLYHDLAVPRWEEVTGRRMWVRYKPADAELFQADLEKREQDFLKAQAAKKQGDPHRVTKAHADLLVKACVAVYDLAIDEQPPEGEFPGIEDYPTFSSSELSEAVGSGPSAIETARKVYATDGDLMIAALSLLDWSAKVGPKAEADFLGS